MDKLRLGEIEEYVFGVFSEAGRGKLLARELFASSQLYPVADLVRALAHLEEVSRLLVRYTKEGNDWVALTTEGARIAEVPADLPEALPHPPRSST